MNDAHRSLRSRLVDALRLRKHLLDGEELTPTTAAQLLELERGAATRLLKALEEAEPRICSEKRGRQKVFRYQAASCSDPVRQLLAVRIARGLMSAFRDSLLDSALSELEAELQVRCDEAMIPDPARMFVSRFRAGTNETLESDTIDVVLEGLLLCRKIEGSYTSFRGRARRIEFEPYTLLLSDNGWHVLGRCSDSELPDEIETERTLNLHRLVDARLSDQRFAYPSRDTHDPEERFRYSFGIILDGETVKPDEPVRFVLHHRWQSFVQTQKFHRSQNTVVRDDGLVEIALDVHPCVQLRSFLRSFGPDLQESTVVLVE